MKIDWNLHWIELRTWASNNPKAVMFLGMLALLFGAMVMGAILF